MIFKEKDCQEAKLQRLNRELQGLLNAPTRRQLEWELAITKSGIQGENDTAYQINFFLEKAKNWTVIHDLRLEWKGRVAQIDHLVFNRMLEAYVVESKNFTTKIRHANGGWEMLTYGRWKGIASPVEQNERHISVLQEVIKEQRLAPTRLGIPMPFSFFNVVLVAPTCSITGTFPKGTRVYRRDEFIKEIQKADGSLLSVLKVVTPQTLHDFTKKLAAHHKVAPVQKSVSKTGEAQSQTNGAHSCGGCGGQVSVAEARYCMDNKNRFSGQYLCRRCQACAPSELKTDVLCAECAEVIEPKVVAFCRLNGRRFGNKLLCRRCQSAASPPRR